MLQALTETKRAESCRYILPRVDLTECWKLSEAWRKLYEVGNELKIKHTDAEGTGKCFYAL